MEVNVHIQRLIIDGPALGRVERSRLTEALSSELGRLITDRGLPGAAAAGFAAPSAPGGQVIGGTTDPEAYGRALARVVYAGLGASR